MLDLEEMDRKTKLTYDFTNQVFSTNPSKVEFVVMLGKFINEYMFGKEDTTNARDRFNDN
jgi:hypothetical protein